MNEKSKEILKKEGWYEGRKIDISEILKYYDNENLAEEYRKHFTLDVFPKAKEFFEAFGDIVIKKNGYPYHIFDLGKIYNSEYTPYSTEQLSILLNQKVLVIGDCSGGMNIIYITESGEIYDSYGYVSKDMYGMWDSILGTVPINDRPNQSWAQLGIEETLWDIEREIYERIKREDNK